MFDEKYYEKAVRLVFDYVSKNFECPDNFSIRDVTLVWFAKTLQNWKAIVVTHTPDQYMYEVSYNGDKREAYIDLYEKRSNVVVPDTIQAEPYTFTMPSPIDEDRHYIGEPAPMPSIVINNPLPEDPDKNLQYALNYITQAYGYQGRHRAG
jgi:hypothetical protein